MDLGVRNRGNQSHSQWGQRRITVSHATPQEQILQDPLGQPNPRHSEGWGVGDGGASSWLQALPLVEGASTQQAMWKLNPARKYVGGGATLETDD